MTLRHRIPGFITHSAFAALVSVIHCSRPASSPRPAAPRDTGVVDVAHASTMIDPLAASLPERLGDFAGGPLTHGDGFVRREYARGGTRVTVTLAQGGNVGPRFYAQWVQMSAGYPPIALVVPRDQGSGFYDCVGADAGEHCDGHVQLAAGYHFELFGNGTATRADLDALISRLPLAALAQPSR